MTHWEFKAAVPPTLLLGLVFMQQSYQAEIPNLSYFTYLDKLYAVAYCLAIWCFGQSVSVPRISSPVLRTQVDRIAQYVFLGIAIAAPLLTWYI